MKAIVVFGNIASGKSTFCKMLQKEIPYLKYVCIDDFRIKNRYLVMNEILKEKKSESECLDAIDSDFILFETTGATFFWDRVRVKLIEKEYNITFIKIETSLVDCLIRFRNRPSKGATPPYVKGTSIHNILYKTAQNIKITKYDFVINSNTIDSNELFNIIGKIKCLNT